MSRATRCEEAQDDCYERIRKAFLCLRHKSKRQAKSIQRDSLY